MRHVVAYSLDFATASATIAGVVLNGVQTTGSYNVQTSYALTYLLFSRADIQAIAGFYIPTSSEEVPVWYAQFKTQIDQMLLPIADDFQVPSVGLP